MKNFTKKRFHPENKEGIYVAELITLVDGNSIGKEILDLLDVESILKDYIPIKGAKELVASQKAINKRYQKEDIESNFNDLSGNFPDGKFTINIKNISNNDYITGLELTEVCTKPIYSTQNDFFEKFCNMDKYAKKLIEQGYVDIVKRNIEMLKDLGDNTMKIRLLHDKVNNEFYSRAIISNIYNNYDNNIAIVIALLMLYKEKQSNGANYELKFYDLNESSISMYFENEKKIKLENIGYVKNIVEVSNDEVKREALKFSGICKICFIDENSEESELLFRKDNINSDILSIRHNYNVSTAINKLSEIEKIEEVHQLLYDDISCIYKIKDIKQIKFFVHEKIKNSRNEAIKDFKNEILKHITNKQVNTIIQLLTLFRNIELIADEDLDAKTYIEYLIYEAIAKRK